MKAKWRLVNVDENGEPIVKPHCPRCGTDLNNPYYCTECHAQIDDGEVVKFFGKQRLEMNVFDECEVHENCTVQILHNSVTNEYSIGWWENHDNE